MNLFLTIRSLYALNGFAAVLLYLPQIVKAWKDREHAQSLSLLSFGGWCVGSLVSALYAWLLVRDRVFTAVSVGNMAGSGAVFVMAARSRIASSPHPHPVPPLEGEGTIGATASSYRQSHRQERIGVTATTHRQGTKRTTLRVSPSSSRRESRT